MWSGIKLDWKVPKVKVQVAIAVFPWDLCLSVHLQVMKFKIGTIVLTENIARFLWLHIHLKQIGVEHAKQLNLKHAYLSTTTNPAHKGVYPHRSKWKKAAHSVYSFTRKGRLDTEFVYDVEKHILEMKCFQLLLFWIVWARGWLVACWRCWHEEMALPYTTPEVSQSCVDKEASDDGMNATLWVLCSRRLPTKQLHATTKNCATSKGKFSPTLFKPTKAYYPRYFVLVPFDWACMHFTLNIITPQMLPNYFKMSSEIKIAEWKILIESCNNKNKTEALLTIMK